MATLSGDAALAGFELIVDGQSMGDFDPGQSYGFPKSEYGNSKFQFRNLDTEELTAPCPFFPKVTGLSRVSGGTVLEVEVPPLAPGEIWSVEASPSLAAGDWSGVGREAMKGRNFIPDPEEGPGTSRFFRISNQPAP